MISQAAEYRPNKIEKLVYLAAYLIPSGKTQREYPMQDTEGVLKPRVPFHEDTQSTTLHPDIYKEGLYADCERDITELAKLLLSHEPFLSAVTPFIQRKMYTEMPCEKVYSCLPAIRRFSASQKCWLRFYAVLSCSKH
jgi:hypothetical protein